AEQQFADSNAAADAALAAVEPVQDRVRTRRAEYLELHATAARHRQLANQAERHAGQLQAIVDYQSLQSRIGEIAERLPKLEQSLETALAESKAMASELEDREKQQAGAERAKVQAMKDVASQEAQLAELRKT